MTICSVCENGNFSAVYLQRDKSMNGQKHFLLIKCNNCGTIIINPAPNAFDMRKAYPKDDYYSFKRIDTSSWKLILKLIFYDTPLLNKLVRRTILKPKIKLLDIGCGSGQFIFEMKLFGLKVLGVEPGDFNEKSAKQQGIRIIKSELIEAKLKDNHFDLITLNHVLEHLKEPNKNLIEIKRLLKDDGTLIIGVPNSLSLAHWMFGKNWYQLDVPRHLTNYSDRSLCFLLNRLGFNVINIRHNSRPEQFSVSLLYALNIRKDSGVYRILNPILKVFFLPLTWVVNYIKMGDQVEVACKKGGRKDGML